MKDLVLRAVGLSLTTSAGVALARLGHDPAAAHGIVGWRAWCEAWFGFLGCSAGGALATLGRHVDDHVKVSRRWTAADVGWGGIGENDPN